MGPGAGVGGVRGMFLDETIGSSLIISCFKAGLWYFPCYNSTRTTNR